MVRINLNETKFLNKETDLKHKDIVKFTNAGAWESSQRFKKDDGTPAQQFNINIELANGEERSTVLSWGNIKLLGSVWGDETEDWVGKSVRAWKTKSEKAKTGYTYVYAPVDWERDDTGEFIRTGTEVEEEDINLDDLDVA